LLQYQLRERFPGVRVFMDLDSIEAGLDFAEVIREAVDSCAVLVALIGRQWTTVADEQGRRRLDDPNDYVRFEVGTALERGVRVIPVLVDGARPLRPEQLPAELQKLARLNASELSYRRYEYDASGLLELIERVLASVGTRIVPESLSTADAEVPAVSQEVRPGGNTISPAAQQDRDSARNDRSRTTHVLIDARRAAESITDEASKVRALADIAAALAATDPDRAAWLIADAESIARSITSESPKGSALADIAIALKATDPDRAESVAQSITNENYKGHALIAIARHAATTDPDRAIRIAQSITDESWKASALGDLTRLLRATDLERLERIARSITNENLKGRALAEIVRALKATDPDRAERIAQSITSETQKVKALAWIAKT
jgi:hypothetical protein